MRGKPFTRKANTAFGRWIDEYCKRNDTSIFQLAKDAGIEASQLYKAREKGQLHDTTLTQLADYLGGAIAYVYGSGQPTRFIHNRTDKIWVLMEKMNVLSDEEYGVIELLLDSIAKQKSYK